MPWSEKLLSSWWNEEIPNQSVVARCAISTRLFLMTSPKSAGFCLPPQTTVLMRAWPGHSNNSDPVSESLLWCQGRCLRSHRLIAVKWSQLLPGVWSLYSCSFGSAGYAGLYSEVMPTVWARQALLWLHWLPVAGALVRKWMQCFKFGHFFLTHMCEAIYMSGHQNLGWTMAVSLLPKVWNCPWLLRASPQCQPQAVWSLATWVCWGTTV